MQDDERERRIAAGRLCAGSNSLTRTPASQAKAVPCHACAGLYELQGVARDERSGDGWVRGRLPDHLKVAR